MALPTLGDPNALGQALGSLTDTIGSLVKPHAKMEQMVKMLFLEDPKKIQGFIDAEKANPGTLKAMGFGDGGSNLLSRMQESIPSMKARALAPLIDEELRNKTGPAVRSAVTQEVSGQTPGQLSGDSLSEFMSTAGLDMLKNGEDDELIRTLRQKFGLGTKLEQQLEDGQVAALATMTSAQRMAFLNNKLQGSTEDERAVARLSGDAARSAFSAEEVNSRNIQNDAVAFINGTLDGNVAMRYLNTPGAGAAFTMAVNAEQSRRAQQHATNIANLRQTFQGQLDPDNVLRQATALWRQLERAGSVNTIREMLTNPEVEQRMYELAAGAKPEDQMDQDLLAIHGRLEQERKVTFARELGNLRGQYTKDVAAVRDLPDGWFLNRNTEERDIALQALNETLRRQAEITGLSRYEAFWNRSGRNHLGFRDTKGNVVEEKKVEGVFDLDTPPGQTQLPPPGPPPEVQFKTKEQTLIEELRGMTDMRAKDAREAEVRRYYATEGLHEIGEAIIARGRGMQ